MAASNRFYSRSRPSLVSTTQDATTNPDFRRITSVEAAVHVLQQQQSGASAQLSDFSTRLDIFEDRIGRQIADALAERDANVPRHTSQSRGKVPREVSKQIKLLHTAWPEHDQFKADQAYKSPHNALVSRNLSEQITRFFKDQFSRHEVTAAVHRYYESRRRAYNDAKPERAEVVRRNCMNSATANRKKRLYNRRSRVLKSASERRAWDMITAGYMSEEESEEYQGKVHFVVHSPDFRSTVLNQLISKLDRRLQKSSAASNGYVAAERVSGSPMEGGLPKKFVRWAIREDISEPQPVPSQLPPRETVEEARVDQSSDDDFDLEGVL